MIATRIPIAHVDIGPAEEEAVLAVLRSGHIAQGPRVEALEAGFAQLADTDHAVAVSSGTAALEAALSAVGIGPGDEVVVPALTFGATANAVLWSGARVRFVDVDDDGIIDADAFAAAVGPDTAAVIPVHLYGLPAAMEAIEAEAARHSVHLLEDAAQAVGARVSDRPVGSFGVGCFSLYATKNITAGEGGVVTTNNGGVARAVRLLRDQGSRRRYEYEAVGRNLRMTDIQAAIANVQLARLDGIDAARRANASALGEALDGIPGLRLPVEPPGRRHAWHLYTVQVTTEARIGRDALLAALSRDGIEAAVIYPAPLTEYACYRDHSRITADRVPRAERISRTALSLPVHPGLRSADVDRIARSIRQALCR